MPGCRVATPDVGDAPSPFGCDQAAQGLMERPAEIAVGDLLVEGI